MHSLQIFIENATLPANNVFVQTAVVQFYAFNVGIAFGSSCYDAFLYYFEYSTGASKYMCGTEKPSAIVTTSYYSFFQFHTSFNKPWDGQGFVALYTISK